jgi:hypothetical protein
MKFQPKINIPVSFLTDNGIARHTFVWRRINQPERVGVTPVIVPDKPWEANCIIARGTSYDATRDKFRLWYMTYDKFNPSPESRYLCYAESSDGFRWEKPNVGQIPYRGSKENNIVLGNLGGLEPGSGGMDCPNVVEDLDDPNPERRFKFTTYAWPKDKTGGYFSATSPDGISWELADEAFLPKKLVGDSNSLFIDHSLEHPYVSFNRHSTMYSLGRRCVYRSHSADFETWTEPELILAPDLDEAPHTEFYNMSVVKDCGQYIGLLQTLHTDPLKRPSDILDVRLAVSEDSFNWKMVGNRAPFFPAGPSGSFDEKWVYLPPHVTKGGYHPYMFFYDGRSVSHWAVIPTGGIGAAAMNPGAWCSLSAGNIGGSVETEVFELPSTSLTVRNDFSHGGSLSVSLVFHDDNTEIEANSLQASHGRIPYSSKIKWETELSPSFVGRPVSLRFKLKSTDLYGYVFED